MQLRLMDLPDPADKAAPTHTNAVSAAEWRAAFHEHFWPAVWRKATKHAAEEVWMSLRPKSGNRSECEALFNDILAATDRAGRAYLERDLEKRPHPRTWLYQRRWLDEEV